MSKLKFFWLKFLPDRTYVQHILRENGSILDLDYHSSQKSCMTFNRFFEWLRRLGRYVIQSRGRYALLLGNSYSANKTSKSQLFFHSVVMVFKLLNTGKNFRPMKVGEMVLLKSRYFHSNMNCAFYPIYIRARDIYKGNTLKAMHALKRLWNALPTRNICSCQVYKNNSGTFHCNNYEVSCNRFQRRSHFFK